MRLIISLLLIMYNTIVFSQSDSITLINVRDLEQIVENQELEGDLDLDNLYEEFENLIANPYNINELTEEQLRDLELFSEIQISSFISYREDYGPLISLYELQAVPHWNIVAIKRLLPFITVKEMRFTSENVSNLVTNGKHTLALKWKSVFQERAGFDPEQNPDYVGGPSHLYARYRYNFNNKLRWGLTMEKDPGEPFFTGSNNYGFDYYSGFLHYYDPLSIIESFSLGDYTISMGQGLISHNAFGSGKSTQAVNIKKGGKVLRPYSSVNEVNYFRGIAMQIRVSVSFRFIPILSSKKIDGTVNQDTTLEDGFESFSSLIEDGYHRTLSEIEKKNSITQSTYGGILKYRKKSFRASANYLYNHFDKPFNPDDQLYRQFGFKNDKLENASLDFSWRIANTNVFGEFARSDNGGTALMIGNQTSLNPRLDVTLAFRDYSRDYQVINPNAFGESRNAVNERGLYIGSAVFINRNFTISAYHDSWKNPWLKFRTDSPSYGQESVLRFEYSKKRRFLLYAQYKNESKSINNSEDLQIRKISDTNIQRLRLHFNNKVTPDLEFRNRIEFSRFTKEDIVSKGWMVYQDILYKPSGSSLSFTARVALFDTDDFDSRIYAYENDILYEFRIPFFQDQGLRFYLHSRYKVTRHLTLEFRYDRTQYNNREKIGSSGEEISGDTRSEIKMQVVYRL